MLFFIFNMLKYINTMTFLLMLKLSQIWASTRYLLCSSYVSPSFFFYSFAFPHNLTLQWDITFFFTIFPDDFHLLVSFLFSPTTFSFYLFKNQYYTVLIIEILHYVLKVVLHCSFFRSLMAICMFLFHINFKNLLEQLHKLLLFLLWSCEIY